MTDSDQSRRPRVSLRGKGRAILLGEKTSPPPEAETNDPAALEDPDPALAALLAGGRLPAPDLPGGSPRVVPGEARPADSQPDRSPASGLASLTPTEPEVWPDGMERGAEADRSADMPAQPLFEAPGPYIGAIQSPNDLDEVENLKAPREDGLIVERPVLEPLPPAVRDPFGESMPRANSAEWFGQTARANQQLLNWFIDDDRLRDLWRQIDDLQEELIESVRGDRCDTDVHLKELLEASALLLQSRENYDDARAVVYRIRADLNRRRKVEHDIARYRPPLLRYHLVWGALWLILVVVGRPLLERAGLFSAGDVQVAFFPVMFGVLGALVSGYLTLDRHTTHLRDFDPLHVSWYVFNPLLGGVMGLFMLLLYAVVNQDVIRPGAAEPMEQAVVWLLCALAGMNQHAVLRYMFRLLDRLASGVN